MSLSRTFLSITAASALVFAPVINLPVAKAVPPSEITAEKPAGVDDREGFLTSQDGKGTQVYWHSQQVPNARGTVVVVHGAAEHSGRYDYVANRLLQSGYNVYRLDHRGHGKTADANPSTRAHIDDFHFLVDDMNLVVQKAKAENPGLKTFMLGHSMGSLASQFYGIKYPGQIDGFVTNGGGAPLNFTGENQPGDYVTPRDMSDMQGQLAPKLWERRPVSDWTIFQDRLKLAQRPNNVEMRLPSLPGSEKVLIPNVFTSGVATDPAVSAEYQNDPLVNPNLSEGMLKQMQFAAVYDGLNARHFTAPTLIMHGTQDGLVPCYFAQDWYSGISSADKELVYWAGQYHEVFNEPAKVEAMDKVIAWIDAHNA
ncbi:alpha/beta hydrolase [Corynebacterium aquilae]|uniref:Lysophospholipase n=1 Tax=Corynebacterium aquilae DSM 44791 TaxID=1431546 RepID=A0A1L7CE07_9CORY|nr:alpha/beta hydrolase [Corynebacterium aquilae]APT84067.1 lysophospholipase [Corynebacterium aquilae DSM 44791]